LNTWLSLAVAEVVGFLVVAVEPEDSAQEQVLLSPLEQITPLQSVLAATVLHLIQEE
jgi:hypothetical protein